MGSKINAKYGEFPGRIPYAKVGEGSKNLIYLVGGPGNDTPQGFALGMSIKSLLGLTDEYTFWVTSRKNRQPENYGTKEMAGDIAAVIREHFGGWVDAVIGVSYGGMIAQYLAADHPGVVGKYLFVATGYKVSDSVLELDRQFAKYQVTGKNGRALYTVGKYVYPPGLKRSIMKIIFFLIGSLMKEKHHEDFESDTLKEAEMSSHHSSMDSLGKIEDPVLVIGGDTDLAFPLEVQNETVSAISGAKQIVYAQRGHGDYLGEKRFADDVKAFISE
jgi:pimeloyl-ACP methyl ester carboxylesterase